MDMNKCKQFFIVFSAQHCGMDWLDLALVAIALPAVLTPLIDLACRRLGWVKDGDLML